MAETEVKSKKKNKEHAEEIANEKAKKHKKEEIQEDEQEKSKSYAALIIAVAVIGVIALGYVASCFAVSGSSVLGHTYVEGVDIKGMTKDEAVSRLTDIYNETYSDTVISVTMNDSDYDIPVFDAMVSPVDEVADEAVSYGHGFFLTRGAGFIESLISSRTINLFPSEIDDAKLNEAIISSKIIEDNSGFSSNWELTDDMLTITKLYSLKEVDSEKLKAAMKDAMLKGDFDTVIESPYTEIRVISPNLREIYNSIYKEPQNAILKPEDNYSVIDSVDGVSFDLDKAEKMYAEAAEGETISVPIEHTKADISSDELKKTLFRDVLGSYTTTVRGSADRRSNVKLAASKCEVIMNPGDVFSYNDTVGKRTEAAGFKKAPAYNNGDTVQELGGGICQASSTLYNAVVIANLEITERHNHSFASSYVPLGQDATVSWGGPDFKFTNNTDYPIKIEQVYENDKLTFNIVGTNITGEYCALTNETLSTNPYGVVEQPSADLYIGESKRTVEGETGYKVKTYRHLYSADGTEISVTEEDTSNYVRRDEVRLVGTKLPDNVMMALYSQMMGQ